ncbi:MBL fold metallo-hydrolase [Profundibacter sp.]|uniref:MBL fold metallo-hydrolase n=1 Tax=Profundibacter sp. TaxID=3101071 RepID=UPI003D105D23
MKHLIPLAIALTATTAQADILNVVNVAPDTYAIVGPLTQRNPENLGNNATFGLVVTVDGAVLMDPGGSYKGAEMLHQVIKGITDQPVKYVIDTGGQDHRWMGNGYWQKQGAQVIASDDAEADHQDRASMQLTGLSTLIGKDMLAGTEPAPADITFGTDYTLELGGVTLQLHHEGAAHTPGDSTVWLADRSTLFAGDIVYVERILGIGPQSNTQEWVASFEALAALKPEHIVPGHGNPTDLATATRDTYDYLINIRTKMADYIDGGGEIIDSVNVDQSAFSYLKNFEGLAGRNAQEVFTQMEWE